VETGSPIVSDEELARQSQAGSLSSFEELVSRHEARIYRFLARSCRNEDDAQELAQITFVTAFRSLHLYNSAWSFGAWLFTIARRKFIDHCRAARPTDELEAAAEPSVTDDPSVILARQETRQDIWRQIRRLLGPDQFGALWLKYQEDMSIRDIARALNRTQTSVKVLLFRARQNLLRSAAHWGAEDQPNPKPSLGSVRCVPGGASSSNQFNLVKQGWLGAQPATNLSAEIK